MDDRDFVKFQAGAWELIAFVIASARGLIDEPASYGPLRLIDTAVRFTSLLHECGLSQKAWDELGEQLSDLTTSMVSQEEMAVRLDRLMAFIIRNGS